MLLAYVGVMKESVAMIFACGALSAVALYLVDNFAAVRLRKAYQLAAFFCLPLGTIVLVHLLSGKNILPFIQRTMILLTYLLFLAVQGIVFAICGRLHTAASVSVCLLAVPAALNWCVYGFRQSIIAPTDIFALGTALSVAGTYKFVLDKYLAIGLVLVVVAMVAMHKNRQPWRHKAAVRIASAVLSVVFIAGLIFAACATKMTQKLGMKPQYWNQMGTDVADFGLYMTWVMDIGDLYLNKPDDYSPETLAETLEQSDSASEFLAQDTAQQPTILFIMNESLTDFELFGDTKLNQDYLPFIHSLATQQSDDVYVGTLSVPVFGAGTCTPEFESLTGFSGIFGYTTTGAYTTLVRDDVPSGVRYYNALGYETVGLHPEQAKNWNRNTAWPYLGFSSGLFEDDIAFERLAPVNGMVVENMFCSDEELYQATLQVMQNAETPQFVFTLTMQNHGAYGQGGGSSQVFVQDDSINFYATEEYLWRARQSDEAFERLLAELETWDKSIMVVMYGDHLPKVDEEYISLVAQNPTEMAAEYPTWARYTTPIVVWNNFGADLSVFPQHTSTAYLQTLVRQAVGLPLTAQDKALIPVMQKYPMLLPSSAIAADGQLISADDLAQDADVQRMKQLMYNAYADDKNRQFQLFLPAA